MLEAHKKVTSPRYHIECRKETQRHGHLPFFIKLEVAVRSERSGCPIRASWTPEGRDAAKCFDGPREAQTAVKYPFNAA